MRKYEPERMFLDWHYEIGKQYHMMDLDIVEFCHRCREPFMLVETSYDTAKATTVIKALAKRAELPAYLFILIRDKETFGIGRVIVRRVWPEVDAGREMSMTLPELAPWIIAKHKKHYAECRLAA